MDYRRFGNDIVLRLEAGEEIVAQLAELARVEGIALAEISGLGALNRMDICVYDVAEKTFYDNRYAEPLELTALVGSITRKEGEPYLHIHATAGNGEGHAFGGHLKAAVVSATAEIFVRVIDGAVGRAYDKATGLNLFAFE